MLPSDKQFVKQRKPRICMLTTRGFVRNAWRCGFYEAQDVLTEVDDVDLIYVKPGKAGELRERFQRFMVWRDFTRTVVTTNMAYHPIRLTREYDLFILYAQYHIDLIQLPAVKGLKDHCKTSILWINEMWADVVPRLKSYLSVLGEFDYVVIGLKGTVKTVSDAIKKHCHWVPVGVDAIRFSPYPDPPPRVIDIYNIGRIWEGVHQAFLNHAANSRLFYVYDTLDNISNSQVKDYRLHRELFANMAKRSRFFFVAPAKMNTPGETKGQIEIGMRYFEGLAAGTVMIGQVPGCDYFRSMFDWPDAVIEIRPDGADASNVLTSLSAQPRRLAEISRRNAAEALLRHDWVYRWEQILDIAGLKPTPELESRKNRLRIMAEQIGNAK
jgi:hypothetical protein